MRNFDNIWENIVINEGNVFKTITGLEFTYRVDSNFIIPNRTEYNISRADIEKAYNLLPLTGPGEINDIVRGPSYVWAILNDKRINK